MNNAIIFGVIIPVGLFGLETLALSIWLYKTTDLKNNQHNKSNKKGKTNGR
jgi:hypothetical protein